MTKGCHGAVRRTATLAAGLLAALLAAGPAAAADTAGIDIDHIEVADGQATVLLGVDRLPGGAAPDPDSVEVRVDGEVVDAEVQPVAADQVQRTTVLALDASNSMSGAAIREAKAAALAFVAAAPADIRIGLLTFSGEVQDVVEPTTDRDQLAAAVDGIELTAGTRVYDAVAASLDLAGADGARSVLVLSDGQDQGGGQTLSDLVGLVSEDSVVVDVVALDQGERELGALSRIATASGGAVVNAADAGALRSVFEREAEALGRQLMVNLAVPSEMSGDVELDIALTAGDQPYSDAAIFSAPAATEPATEPSAREGSDSAPVGRTAMLVGAVSVGVGIAILLVVLLLGSRDNGRAHHRLAGYFGEEQAGTKAADLKGTAVAVAGAMVPSDIEARISRRLAGAGLSFTASEWVLVHAGIAVVAAAPGFVLGGILGAILFVLLGAVGPYLYLRLKHARRLRAFGAQLPDMLTMVANSLAAGLSVPQAIDTVVRDGRDPMASELRRALVEQRLGVDVEDALDGVAARMGSEDFGWVVMAIRIQREVGGNLSEVLQTVGETLREREYLRRQVRTLSAEGRLSAWILGGLPPAMFGYMLFANREYIRALYTEPLGWIMLGVGAFLLAIGTWFMSKLVKVEV